MTDVLERIGAGDQTPFGTVPAAPPRPTAAAQTAPQTHELTDAQIGTIFACYRQGVGPREISRRYGVTERAIKYLLKKHGVQRVQSRSGGRLFGGQA